MKPSERIRELVLKMRYFYPESESAALHLARQNQNLLDQIVNYLDEQYEENRLGTGKNQNAQSKS